MGSPLAKRMTADELDDAAIRLEEIGLEEEKLRSKLLDQVGEFGFTPPRAGKSKRLEGSLFQFTVSRGVTMEIKDAEVGVSTTLDYKTPGGVAPASRLLPEPPMRFLSLRSATRQIHTSQTLPTILCQLHCIVKVV